VLLMDEPSEGLAPQIVAEVMATIRQLKLHGLSIVLVEQNAKLVFDVADDIVILNSGRVVVDDTVEALRRDVGGRLVDRAVDQLRAQKLLPAAFADPSSSGTPADGLKRRIQTALREHRPLSGESYPEWAKRVLPSDEPQSVSNILSTDNVLLRDKSMWKEAGGTPARPGRKKRV